MKKNTLILLLTLVLFSCSKDDDSTSSNISINPPSWIQGTWVIDNDYTYVAFKFTSNDMYILMDGIEMSFVQTSIADSSFTFYGVYDVSTNSTYSIHRKGDGIDIVIYEFTKVSDTKINVEGIYNSDFIKQ
ncbi:hypothetical protein [Lutibacter sp.]|uniref:hypothetical protein n=1 Tax=Lutibacter sp. TaxID=1925666 RepID=UPI0035664D0C